MSARSPLPRFSTEIETVALPLPDDGALGPVIAAVRGPQQELYVLHQGDLQPDPARRVPDLVRFGPGGDYVDAWGGPDHLPAVDGVPQWPTGAEGLECDAEGNLWIFGYQEGDDAVLKFSPSGELLLRIGQRGRAGDDDDTRFLDRPTSCYHDVESREVFVSDGYGNHRIISFDSDTGQFRRMWGAYGKRPSSLSEEEGFGNPVHKVAPGPDGRMYVCDRIKNRLQEFELAPDGASFLREVVIAPGTMIYGAAFDLALAPGGQFIYVADGSNCRIWTIDLDSFEVVDWHSTQPRARGRDNLPAHYAMVHRFAIEPSGDLLLASVQAGLRRMRFLGFD